jgi:hypothetical protein
MRRSSMLEDPLDRIVKNVIHETLPKSIRLRVSVAQSNPSGLDSDAPASITIEQTYAETSRGERVFDERRLVANQPVSHSASFCDGEKCANLVFSGKKGDSQKMASISHGFMYETRNGFRDGPEPLRFYHVGLIPLHEALSGAERMGEERVIERICDNFHFRDVGPAGRKQSLVYSLDRETSVPLKIVAYANPDRIREGSPNWSWQATSLDKISGRHYPLRSTYASSQRSKADPGRPTSEPDVKQTIRVEEIEFDAAIPKTTFWPTFQPGVAVADTVSKHKFRVPGGESPRKEEASVGTPIRVAPESGSWLPGAGLALSIAVLAVAAILWRSSR